MISLFNWSKKMKKWLLLLLSFQWAYAENKTAISEATTTDMVFILDRSGSMSGLERDTIGGFNSLLNKQKQDKKNEAWLTTVLFDHDYELLHHRVPLQSVSEITEKEYFVRGNTALLDAIGKTIIQIKNDVKDKKNHRVLFVIITDGEENSSKEFTLKKVKDLVEAQQKEQWEFLFLGANIDAISVANSVGISAQKAATYKADGAGTQKNYEAVNQAFMMMRSGKELDESWKKEIEQDVEKRGK